MASIALPRQMLVGGGTVKQLGPLLTSMGFKHPLVVSDAFLSSSRCGIVDMISKGLDQHEVKHDVFCDTIEDPTTESVDKCRQALVKKPYDCIVAVGGGSPMDTAKAASVLHVHGGQMRDYKAPFQMNDPALPVIAVPTTAGTGSEATKFTIVTDSDTEEKMLCIGLAYLPLAAVVDYELTLKKPWRLTADTGIDAMCHAMEAYVSKKQNMFSDSLALASLTKINRNLHDACSDPSNRQARESLMLASTEAGMAFSNSSVTLIHGMSRPIGALFHVPHGLSNAMLAPSVTQFSLSGSIHRYAQVARSMDLCSDGVSDSDAADSLSASLYRMNKTLKVPSMKEWGIDEELYLANIPKMATAALASGSPANNPVVPTQAEIEALYIRAWNEE